MNAFNSYMIRLIIILSLCLTSSLSTAQTWDQYYFQGKAHYDKGNFNKAISTLVQARMIAQQQFGIKHEYYQKSQILIAQSYSAKGDYKNSSTTYRDLEKQMRENHQDGTTTYLEIITSLAREYEKGKQYPAAAQTFEKAMAGYEKLEGKKKNYAQVALEAGRIYALGGKFEQAYKYFNDVAPIFSSIYGATSLEYIEVIKEKAQVLSHLKQYNESNKLFEEFIQKSKAKKKESNYYADAYWHLGNNFLKMNQHPAAITNFTTFIDIKYDDKETSPELFIEEVDKAIEFSTSIKDWESTINFHDKKVKYISEKIGKDKEIYVQSLTAEIPILWKVKNFEKSNTLISELLETQKTNFGESSEQYAAALVVAANNQMETGNEAEAEKTFSTALELLKGFGETSSTYTKAKDALAYFYLEHDKNEEALKLFLETKKVREKKPGKGHPDYAESLKGIYLVKKKEEKFKEAEPILKEAGMVYKSYYGEVSKAYTENVIELADFYKLTGRDNDALKTYLSARNLAKQTHGEGSDEYSHILEGIKNAQGN